ncbi:helix-turn-helix domain-containing protein [Streptomyces sp. NPDC127072]|uniref:helix-turn-helix domain-containing protein n=1 Tax=Streptomyces sp. NPDC127072 TaxID=3347129 RepID=UPI003663804C
MVTHAPASHAWKRLGNHFRERRLRQHVTQEFTAAWLRVDRSTIVRIEAGVMPPSAALLVALETALGLPVGSSFAVLAGRTAAPVPTLADPSEGQPTVCGHEPYCQP